jgi:hypothetical protein
MAMRRLFAHVLAGVCLAAVASIAVVVVQDSAAPAAPVSRTVTVSPAGVSALPWYTQMENACRNIYANRGSPGRASSGNKDDQQALYAAWAANLQNKAVIQMQRSVPPPGPGLPNYIRRIVQTMAKIRDLNRELVPIYLSHPIINQRLLQITLVELPQLEKQFSQYRQLPSCVAIAQLGVA